MVWIKKNFTVEIRSENPRCFFTLANFASRPFLIAYIWVWTSYRHTRSEQSNTLMGRLTAEGPKPQALPRPTLLCNSCPEAIMHGACQAGLVLSHHHTSILAFCHIHEHSLELYSWLTWVEIKIYTKIRSAVMTVHLKAGFPLLCHRNIGYFKAKKHKPITELPLGVFPLDLHWCCNIVALLSVLYRKAFVWSSAYGCSG